MTGRWLPGGWIDALRQIALFGGAYYAYRLVRGFVDGQEGLAFENARTLVDWERAMGLFFEPGLQAWAKSQDAVIWAANWMYVNSHFVVTTTFLIWLYIARNHAYYFVRNMFMVSMGFALIGYMAYPTAPPRFLPEWGFTDTVASFVGESAANSANVLYNPYAAVPSMHVAFALMIAVPAIALVKHRVFKVLWGLYPLARDLRGRGHGQPLLARRRVRRRRRRRVGLDGVGGLRPRPARSLGLAPRRGHVSGTAAPRPREIREIARDRLIESRLTPNAISLTGLVLNVVAAVLVTQRYFFLAGVAFIVGSVMDMLDGRYSRMSGKGTPFGAFLDSTLDRIEEGVVLAAVAAYFAESGRRAGGDRRRGGRAVLADGQLHPRAGRGARGGVQGRDRRPPGARGDPLRRPGLRQGRLARRLRAARAGRLHAGRAHAHHDFPAYLSRAPGTDAL